MGLALWWPQPRAVAVAGRTLVVSELRLRDLAALEAFAAAVPGRFPTAGLDPSAGDYPDRLRAAYDLAGDWPPDIRDDGTTDAVMADPAGRTLLLRLATREHPIGVAEAERIAREADGDDWSRLVAAAWGAEDAPRAVVVRLIDEHLGLPDFAPRRAAAGGEGVTLAAAVGKVVATLAWASPEAVGDLTISQWRSLQCGGEPEEEGDALPADPELCDRVLAARVGFFGLPADGPGAEAEEATPDGLPEGEGEWETVI